MLGSPILYLKGMRIMMFQLSGFYSNAYGHYETDDNTNKKYSSRSSSSGNSSSQ